MLAVAAAVCSALIMPAHPQFLSKRCAQRDTVHYAGLVAPLLDTAPTDPKLTVSPPRRCHRRDNTTVLCWFSVRLVSEPRTVTGFMRVHLQRDGVLGYQIPWVPLDVCANCRT